MRILIPVVCLSLAVAGCHKGAEEVGEDKAVKPVVEVTLEKAVSKDIPVTIDAPATVFAREQASIASRITSPIRRLLVRKGDNVKSGQLLAELENRDLVAQRAEAQGALSNAEATLQKTVSGTIPSDVERARGQVETTRAALGQAEQVFNKRQGLFNQGAIPERDFSQSRADLATAKANFEVAQRSFDLLQNQSRGRDEQIARSNVTQARARLQGSNAQIDYTQIRAPFPGTITDQVQYPGDMAQASSPIFTIADLSAVTARAQVPEASAGSVSRGQACTFHSVDQKDREIEGKITVVNRAVDLQRRTVEVWCEVSKPPDWVRAGMFGTVSIQAGVVSGAVLIPKAAVQQEEGTNQGTAFVVDGKHVAHKREVQLGAAQGDLVQITSGVKPGETVVVEGSYGLPDKAEVVLKGQKKADKEEKE